MKSTRIMWDEKIAARCISRLDYELKPANETTPEDTPVLVDIKAGEWDRFEYALSAALRKKH